MTAAELWILLGVNVDTTSVKNAEGVLDRLNKGIRRLVALEGFRAVAGFIEHVTESATHLVSLSHAMGTSIEVTQELGYVAQQSGSNLKEMSVGVSMFIGNLRKYAAGGGSKQFKADMHALGMSQAAAAKSLVTKDGLVPVLGMVSDHLKKMGTSGNQAGLGRELFGARAGRAMVADLARGSDVMHDLMERRRKMGELNEQQAMSLRDLGNRTKDVKTQLEALGSVVLAKLAPSLIAMADAAMDWMAANKDLISGAFETALNGIAFAFSVIGNVISGVVSVVRWFADTWNEAADGSLKARMILLGIATVIAAFIVPAFAAWFLEMAAGLPFTILGLALVADAAWAAMIPFLPLILIIAAVAAGALLVIKYWEPIKEFFSNVWDSIKGGLVTTWDALTTFGSDVADFFSDVWNGIGAALEAVFDWMRNLPVIKQIIDAVEWARDKLSSESAVPDDAPWYAKAYGAVDPLYGMAYGAASKDYLGDGVPSASPASMAPSSSNPSSMSPPVTFTTTVNINGVSGAEQVPGQMGRAGDELARRHASAALTGGR